MSTYLICRSALNHCSGGLVIRSPRSGTEISRTILLSILCYNHPNFLFAFGCMTPVVDLEKDSRDRYHDISDVRVDIRRVLADPSGVFVQPVTTVEPRGQVYMDSAKDLISALFFML
jgi:hypothetical protein